MGHLGRTAAAIGTIALSSCATVQQTTDSTAFQDSFASADYCELSAVRQRSRSSCGAACLESLLSYWELDGDQTEILGTEPPGSRAGYSLAELKGMAKRRGLTAFKVSFEASPLDLLHGELAQGRPVLLAVRCPLGRYFGEPVPLIEHLDTSVISFSVREERLASAPIASTRGRLKDHYVLAFGYDKGAKQVLLMDPAYGLVSVGENRLLQFWGEQNYAALVCAR